MPRPSRIALHQQARPALFAPQPSRVGNRLPVFRAELDAKAVSNADRFEDSSQHTFLAELGVGAAFVLAQVG